MFMISQFIMRVNSEFRFLFTHQWMTLKATCDMPVLCLWLVCR